MLRQMGLAIALSVGIARVQQHFRKCKKPCTGTHAKEAGLVAAAQENINIVRTAKIWLQLRRLSQCFLTTRKPDCNGEATQIYM